MTGALVGLLELNHLIRGDLVLNSLSASQVPSRWFQKST